MTFKTEKQLRKLWRDSMGVRQRFIEPSLGGTFGLPDAFGLKDGVMYGAELKKGVVKGNEFRFTVRASQRTELPDLLSDGAKVVCAIAEVKTAIVHVLSIDLMPHFGALSGVIDMVTLYKRSGSTLPKTFRKSPDGEFKVVCQHGTVGGNVVTWVIYGEKAVNFMADMQFQGLIEGL